VQEALNALGQNRTVLIIAHRLSTIRNADQIVVLDAGVVVEKGTHDNLVLIEGGYYQKLWKMQMRQKDNDVSLASKSPDSSEESKERT
jgi:ABC-type multidrug transport system fused ATPase/permease subunit